MMPALGRGSGWSFVSLAAGLLLLGLAGAPSLLAETGARAEGDAERGRSIYHQGVTAEGGTIDAAFGDQGFVVEASVLPCASCHGRDGKGKPEGGVSPSNLTWHSLTHPRGARGGAGTNRGGRSHPPYDERSVVKAITMGLDPAGNELDSTMPRYRLSHQDAADLVAYLRQLEHEKDPGISDDTLVISTLRAHGSSQGTAVEDALRAFFDEVNDRGGVYGRKVRFRPLDLPITPGAQALADDLGSQLEADPPFALVAADMTRREAPLARLFSTRQLPVVGPFAVQPQLEMPPNPYVFYLLGGVQEQVASLLDFARQELAAGQGGETPGRLLIVQPASAGLGDPDTELWAEAAVEAAQGGPWSEVARPTPEELFSDLSASSSQAQSSQIQDTVLLLGGGSALSQFLARADHSSWYPKVLIPGVFAGSNILSAPPSFDGHLYLAFPVLPSDARPDKLQEVWQLADRHDLPKQHLAAQLSALAAAQVLIEGLHRAGRELSRERLIQSLEGLYKHPTGLLPPVTFTPNRRLGAPGAHIVRANLQTRNFEPLGERVVPR
ncbi:MAG: ABC transporter substrate-binding protein [Acidobacteriota bacterium]|nr:ABC transporter substrate-binding protein [Acidobacteriota bacterium]